MRHENAASFDWRTKCIIIHITHHLLGIKVPGTLCKPQRWPKKLYVAAKVTQDQLFDLPTTTGARLDDTRNLVAHEDPRLSVLKISFADLEPGKASNL